MKQTLHPGAVVDVYHDPVTQLDLEGSARVLKVLYHDDHMGTRCEVKFIPLTYAQEEEMPVQRWIRT